MDIKTYTKKDIATELSKRQDILDFEAKNEILVTISST